ncbi:MAG: BBP7 family outer membrane beta-barrel protein [Pirellulaceae bacterium]
MQTIDSRHRNVVRRLGVLALLAAMSLAPATAWGQLAGRPVAQPYFDFPNWARFSDCRPDPLAWGYEVFPNYGPVDCAYEPNSVACEVDFVAHRSDTWYASADFAPLTIDYQNDFDIARLGATGETLLDTGELRPEFDAGGKFTVGRRVFGCYRIEGTYLGNYDWQDTVLLTNDDADLSTFLSDFADPPIAGLDGASSVSMSFQSSFQSAEANIRYWAEMPPGPFDVSYLVGARYLRIHEQFNFLGDVPVPATLNDSQVNTENDLYGVQIGIQGATLLSTRWWIDFDLKGGIYNNQTSVATSFIQNGVETGGFVERDRTAWVGDLSLVANWQMTPQWTFRIGYQAIFVNGLALAPDNTLANADLFGTNTARLDDSGELAYHGPIIGLMWIR